MNPLMKKVLIGGAGGISLAALAAAAMANTRGRSGGPSWSGQYWDPSVMSGSSPTFDEQTQRMVDTIKASNLATGNAGISDNTSNIINSLGLNGSTYFSPESENARIQMERGLNGEGDMSYEGGFRSLY